MQAKGEFQPQPGDVVVVHGHTTGDLGRSGVIIEVLTPGTSAPRVVQAPASERLHGELFGRGNNEGGPCPAT